MRALNDSDFLGLWESGSRRHPLDQALLTLGVAFPEAAPEDLAFWPLGRRNRELIELYCRYFGSKLSGFTTCTDCGEKLEVEVDGRALAGAGPAREGEGGPMIDFQGEKFRVPTTRDLAGVAREENPRVAAVRLIEGCRVGAGGRDAWTDNDLAEIGERLAGADPLAEIRLRLRCPECGREEDQVLDLVAFFWAEIDARVRRLLRDIHTLASAYGWGEREILSLTESRRALYLEMVQT
jgi:hypothetical protein